LELDEQSLHVLSCDIEVRPRDAAGIEELLPYLRKIETVNGDVLVYFEMAGAAALESFVDAERLCCTGLTWKLGSTDDLLQLIVGGTPDQTALIKQWFAPDPE
jgi:hypothetical protein